MTLVVMTTTSPPCMCWICVGCWKAWRACDCTCLHSVCPGVQPITIQWSLMMSSAVVPSRSTTRGSKFLNKMWKKTSLPIHQSMDSTAANEFVPLIPPFMNQCHVWPMLPSHRGPSRERCIWVAMEARRGKTLVDICRRTSRRCESRSGCTRRHWRSEAGHSRTWWPPLGRSRFSWFQALLNRWDTGREERNKNQATCLVWKWSELKRIPFGKLQMTAGKPACLLFHLFAVSHSGRPVSFSKWTAVDASSI